MNKDNIFKSSSFYMSDGDVLHMIIRDEVGNAVPIELYGSASDEIPENDIVVDVDGVINVNVDGNSFATSEETPNLHGMLLYGGYVYGSPRYPYGTDGIARILKIRTIDYTDITTVPIRYASESDTQSIYYMEQLQRIGFYLYTAAFANVSGVSTNLLIQFDTRDDSYKIFKITDEYGSVSAKPILVDDTYIYYAVVDPGVDPNYFTTTTILKYTASDFQDASWPKFNTSLYDHTGVPIAPVSATEFLADDYYTPHAWVQDTTHIYMSFLYGNFPVIAGKLLKITKTTMALSASADIPNCSDDIADSGTHIFLGVETSAGDYGSTWANVAVRKSDMAITELLPHSTEGANQMSYGVRLLSTGTGTFLFDMRKDKRINILDITNVDSWTDAVPSDGYSKRILSFVYSDGDAHYIPNEIELDDDGLYHVFTWATIPEIIRFYLNAL